MQSMQREQNWCVREHAGFGEAWGGVEGRAQEMEEEQGRQGICLMEFTSC